MMESNSIFCKIDFSSIRIFRSKEFCGKNHNIPEVSYCFISFIIRMLTFDYFFN